MCRRRRSVLFDAFHLLETRQFLGYPGDGRIVPNLHCSVIWHDHFCCLRDYPSVQVKRLLWPLTYLGEISFGIYLWHLPVLLSLKRLNWLSFEQIVVLALVLTITLASVSWHFFERPLMQKYARSTKKVSVQESVPQVEKAAV